MNTTNHPARIIVVGTSAGGLDALQALVARLEPEIPAALLIVQHLSRQSPGLLPALLERAGPLPAAMAEEGRPIRAGQIIVAPPDWHLLVDQDSPDKDGPSPAGYVRLSRSPRQNRARPSIDVLFRSAAVVYSTRTVGVLLTGMLDDGVAGLRAIQRCGGMTVVQEPAEARYPEMVESALAAMAVDYRLPVAEIADLLNRLAHEPVAERGHVPEELRLEVAIHLAADSDLAQMERVAEGTSFSCPDCGGRLWQTSSEDQPQYLCEIGHAYSGPALLEGMDREIERSLWAALRTLEERMRMLERMAGDEEARGRERVAADLRERAAETRADAQNLRRFLLRKMTYGGAADLSVAH